jgi:hypothetical protein
MGMMFNGPLLSSSAVDCQPDRPSARSALSPMVYNRSRSVSEGEPEVIGPRLKQ